MSAEIPVEELDEILDLCAQHHLPQAAEDWATSAKETAESILETIDTMLANWVDAPTERQAEALDNIYRAACN